jgi:hypothetical protein
MRIGRFNGWWAAPVIAASLSMLSDPVRAEQPQVGDIYDIKPGGTFRGWKLAQNMATEVPSAVFESGGHYIVAFTEVLYTRRQENAEVWKITAVQQVQKQPGEAEVINVDCTLLTATPALSFFSKATGIARAFFIFPGEIREQRWFPNPDQPCEYGGD